MKKENNTVFWLVPIYTFIVSNIVFLVQDITILDSILLSLINAFFAEILLFVCEHRLPNLKKSEQRKKTRSLKKTKTPNRRSFCRRLFAKLRLWNTHREWRKSDNGRSIPKMQRHFKKWAKLNPEMAETIQVIISQMHQLALDHDIFEDVVEDSNFGYKGEDSRKVFDHTASQIRQNFNDMYNLMVLAGANEGLATMKTIDLSALAWELNGNRTKLALLAELNTQIVRLVNQIDSVHDNVMTEAEIEALAILNAMRFSKATGFAAEAKVEAESETDSQAGTTAPFP